MFCPLLQLLLDVPEVDVNHPDDQGMTPFLAASCLGHAGIVQLLLQVLSHANPCFTELLLMQALVYVGHRTPRLALRGEHAWAGRGARTWMAGYRLWRGAVVCCVGPPPPVVRRTRFGIENKDALMPDSGVHYLWFAFVCFLIRSHPPGVFSSRQAAGCSFRPCR